MRNFRLLKTTIFFFLCIIFTSIHLFAQDEEIAWNNGDEKEKKVTGDEDVVWVFDAPKKEKADDEIIPAEPKKLVRVPDRKIEIGIFSLGLGFSNDFMKTSEIFKEKVNLNTDKLSDGFNVNANLFLFPLYFNFNNNTWGFGLSTGLYVIGIIDLNGNLLTFHEDSGVNSDIGAAVFTDVAIHGFYTYEKFKIKIKPSLYYPILYAKPDNFSYTYKNKKINGVDQTFFITKFDMRVYTAYPVEDDFNLKDILKNLNKFSSSPGIDFSIGAEYPLSDVLELTKIYDFLDFDVGLDFLNIPLYPSSMEDYKRVTAYIGSNEPIDFFSGMLKEEAEEIDTKDYYKYSFGDYEKGKRNVFRPFKMLISANWRPFYRPSEEDTDEWIKRKKEWVTFKPTLGFAISPLYFQSVSFEGGIKSSLSLYNLFIVSLDIGYHDRLWKNILELTFNVKILELNLGVGMQSASFLKSWSGGGFGAAIGFKFGW